MFLLLLETVNFLLLFISFWPVEGINQTLKEACITWSLLHVNYWFTTLMCYIERLLWFTCAFYHWILITNLHVIYHYHLWTFSGSMVLFYNFCLCFGLLFSLRVCQKCKTLMPVYTFPVWYFFLLVFDGTCICKM